MTYMFVLRSTESKYYMPRRRYIKVAGNFTRLIYCSLQSDFAIKLRLSYLWPRPFSAKVESKIAFISLKAEIINQCGVKIIFSHQFMSFFIELIISLCI